MTPKKVDKIVCEVLKIALPQYEHQKENFYYFKDDVHEIRYNFYSRKIGGEIYLEIIVLCNIINIEDKWIKFQPELGLQTNLFNQSFHQSFIVLDKSKYPTLTNLGLKVHYNESDEWVKENARSIIVDYFMPFTEKLKDIQYCDQLINKDIEITEEVTRISPIDGLPFRKILIAEAAGNPRLDLIKSAMRTYCEEQFELGKKERFEELCKIKPVFEKLFGI